MFLKKIKIDGFKSFAKPIIIDFQSPLTTIVGPNGSGKSNIVDAIRWALGEQSAKTLRGSKMADVIFAGSKDYKPLKKASVTLYFDNSSQELPIEANEVRICRQVTEDGQSDYMINGTVCRLKDIEELLMDTGMGKDAYSIVGQGKIDSILNSKPEKLRELFEEAAGISKHKMRKDEAERRLEKTRHDLQRIKDLIWELDKQVIPLKKSAEKARKYNRLKEEMGVLEVNLLLDRWEKNQDVLVAARKERDTLQEAMEVLENELEDMDSTLRKKRAELEAEEGIIETLQNNFYQSRIKKEQAENNLKVLDERNQGLLREKSSLKQVLNELEQENKELLVQQERIDQRLSSVIEEDKELSERLARVQFKLNEQKNLLEAKKAELFSRRNSVLNENMELKDLHAELEKTREKGRYLELEIEKMVEKRKELSSQLDEVLLRQDTMMKKLNKISSELEEGHHNFDLIRDEENKLQGKIEEIQQRIGDLNKELFRHKSRLQVLTDMESDFQGYFHGVKMILKAGFRFPGVIGVVADLINVEKEFELAIETALGGKLQNIVVEDDTTARHCVDYLKKENAGRATFLPINMVRGDKLKLEWLNLDEAEGFLGIASEFISCDQRLIPIIDSLLGRTLLSRDLKSATMIAKKIKSRFKIVTLEGDVIHPGGSITGGSRSEESKGLLGRSREIEELNRKIEELDKRIESEHKLEESQQKEIKELKTRQDENKYRITNLEFQKNDLTKDISNLKNEQARLEQELEKLDKEFVEYHEKLGEIDNLKQKLQQEIQMVHDEHSREKDRIGDMEEEVKQIEVQEEEVNKDIADLRVELATVKQKKENLLNEKNILFNQLNNNQEKMENTSRQLTEIEDKFTELNRRKDELAEMKLEFARKIEELEREYNEKHQLFKEKEKATAALQNKYQKTQQTLGEHKEKYHRVELKITRLEDKNEQITEKLAEYEVNPEEGIKERIEISNYSQANKKIKEFRDAMKSLEPVNPGAIQEHEDLKERLEYLETQQQDLLEARDSIIRIIGEIEKTMGQMFYKTFNKVKGEFEKIFMELFDGGNAELKLTTPDDLLNTGIEIEAQPPGKQLKKLSLMSGGERALTAIALVFAFLQVNPSPIYILDEIDAPLDDANVLRFARFVKRYSRSVQFLLITHNKKMMTEANIIYGITMEEPGVSKLISLRLDEEIA
jgi:chromosome segregation protein